MEGKVFAVTGAGSGIGRATAVRLAELGAQGLAISDVDEAGLEETKRCCKSRKLVIPVMSGIHRADIRSKVGSTKPKSLSKGST